MLYNLIIINSESGINVANIILSEKGISDDNTQLMSGILKAIESFLKELSLGEIKTFNTHNRKVLISQAGVVLAALILDENDDSELYLPKLQYVSDLFGNSCKWENWCGEIDIFTEEIELAKKVFTLTDDEIIKHLEESLYEFIRNENKVIGFKIINNGKTVISFFKDLEDFELQTFFQSEISNSIMDKHDDIEKILTKVGGAGLFEESFIDYGRFSIFVKHYITEFHILLFLPGKMDILKDLEPIIRSINIMGVF